MDSNDEDWTLMPPKRPADIILYAETLDQRLESASSEVGARLTEIIDFLQRFKPCLIDLEDHVDSKGDPLFPALSQFVKEGGTLSVRHGSVCVELHKRQESLESSGALHKRLVHDLRNPRFAQVLNDTLRCE